VWEEEEEECGRRRRRRRRRGGRMPRRWKEAEVAHVLLHDKPT